MSAFIFGGQLPADYFQQDVNYRITVKLDDEAHTLDGFISIEYHNQSPDTLEYIWMHLWPNAYKNDATAFAKQKLKDKSTRFHFSDEKDRGYIDSLDFKIDGQVVEWRYHPDWNDVAVLQLVDPVYPGGVIQIETPFHVKIPKVFSRLGHTGKHYEITQWYPKPAVYDRYGWHAMPYLDMGEFYSEFGTFDVSITLPRDYVVMATGELMDNPMEVAWLDSLADIGSETVSLDKKALKEWVKKQNKKIKKRDKREKKNDRSIQSKTLRYYREDIHDFAWFADRDYIVNKGSMRLPASGREISLWTAFLPKNAELWRSSIEYLEDTGYWYSTLLGDYPYGHITAVDGDMSAGGGMEYPEITVISSVPSKDLLEMVIMHEAGHNWLYGALGSNERKDPWIDEGLNEYNNIMYWEGKYGPQAGIRLLPERMPKIVLRNADYKWMLNYLLYQLRSYKQDDQPLTLPAEDYYPANYGAIVYGKTGAYFRFLSHYLGDENMLQIQRDFFQTWKFRHPGSEDCYHHFQSMAEKDVSWFFDDMMPTTRFADYAVLDLSGTTLDLHNYGQLSAPVEIVCYDSENRELTREWASGFTGQKTITINQDCDRVILDPDEMLPDINRSNQSSKKSGLSVPIIFDEPDFTKFYPGNLVPTVRLNAVNRSFGLGLYRGTVPQERISYRLMPSWDFSNDEIIGSAKIQLNYFRKWGADELHPFLAADKCSGRESISLGFKAILRKPIVEKPNRELAFTIRYHQFPDLDAFNPLFWTVDRPVFSYTLEWGKDFDILTTLRFTESWSVKYANAVNGGGSYFGYNYSAEARHKMTTDILMYLNLGLSGVESGDLTQYFPSVQGSLDPDFEHLVYNRTDGGDFSLIDQQYVPTCASLRIAPAGNYLPYTSGGNIGFSVTGLGNMGGVFADAFFSFEDPLVIDSKDYTNLLSCGVSLDLTVFKIYLPLYMSWYDNQPEFGGRVWREHIRAQFTFDKISISIGM